MLQLQRLVERPTNTYTINLLVTDANGCEGTASKTIEVHAVPTAVLSASKAFCVDNSTPELITATITPSTLTGTGFGQMQSNRQRKQPTLLQVMQEVAPIQLL